MERMERTLELQRYGEVERLTGGKRKRQGIRDKDKEAQE
jgi:hypothetical protein